MNYTLVKDELDRLIGGFRENSHVTAAQKERFLSANNRTRPFSHEQFSKDGSPGGDKPVLVLCREDGFVEQPLGSLGHKSARAFWYTNNDSHAFIPMPDMVRICFFFHCPLVGTLHLVLKNEWERYLARRRGYKTCMGTDFSKIIPGAEPVDEDFVEFRPDVDGMLNEIDALARQVLDKAPESAVAARLQEQGFYADRGFVATITREIELKRLMILDSSHPALEIFARGVSEELADSDDTDEDAREEYLNLKTRWVILIDESAHRSFELNKVRIENGYIKKRFLAIFGEEYIAIQELILSKSELSIRFTTRQSRPGISEEELIEILEAYRSGQSEKLEDLKDWSRAPRIAIRGSGEMDGEDLRRYEAEVVSLIKELEKILHPDLLERNPSYRSLSEGQKEQLREYFVEVMKIRSEDCIYDENHLFGHLPSLHKLKMLKMKVEGILNNLGVDQNGAYVIQGKTLADKCAWLSEFIAILEKKNLETHETMIALATDPEIVEMTNIAADEENHPAYRDCLREQIADLKLQIADLEKRLNELDETGEETA